MNSFYNDNAREGISTPQGSRASSLKDMADGMQQSLKTRQRTPGFSAGSHRLAMLGLPSPSLTASDSSIGSKQRRRRVGRKVCASRRLFPERNQEFAKSHVTWFCSTARRAPAPGCGER